MAPRLLPFSSLLSLILSIYSNLFTVITRQSCLVAVGLSLLQVPHTFNVISLSEPLVVQAAQPCTPSCGSGLVRWGWSQKWVPSITWSCTKMCYRLSACKTISFLMPIQIPGKFLSSHLHHIANTWHLHILYFNLTSVLDGSLIRLSFAVHQKTFS